jgi:hypothetical protein
MSHYARLDKNNVVVFVITAKSDNKENEFTADTGNIWKQTSYNTIGGVHYTTDEEGNRIPSEDQTKAFRKNYAGIGFTYDENLEAFIPPKPFDSWVLNEDTCLWEAPIPYPENSEGIYYEWNESNQSWDEVPSS